MTGAASAVWAGAWVVVLGAFGILLALFNLWITFPKPVK